MKKKTQTIEVHAAHVAAALASYLTIYYPGKMIDFVDVHLPDETLSVTLHYAETKAANNNESLLNAA
jgi:hypothetical protein